MVGFFVACYFLRDVLNSVFVCDANIILHDISKTHCFFRIVPTDFIQLMNTDGKSSRFKIFRNW